MWVSKQERATISHKSNTAIIKWKNNTLHLSDVYYRSTCISSVCVCAVNISLLNIIVDISDLGIKPSAT